VTETLRLVTALRSSPDVRIVIPATAENVSVVRQALAGLGESLDIPTVMCDDMKVAVTEACTNAIVHGYLDSEGWLEVAMEAPDGHVRVAVKDSGAGFHPPATDPDRSAAGYGLSLIATLSDRFELVSDAGGTTIEMAFNTSDPEDPVAMPEPLPLGPPAGGRIELAIASNAFTGPVLGRVVAVLSGRADFSVDRLSDAELISDAIAQHAAANARDATLRVAIAEPEGAFELAVGPLVPGGARRIIEAAEIPGLGNVLERLAAIEIDGEGHENEVLRVTVAATPA
jgi:anti-sigma regulatory factor (Ser/Thr protein kinase)